MRHDLVIIFFLYTERSAMKTGFYTNPIYLEHDTGSHPENANRLRAILERLESEDLMGKFKVEAGRPASSA